MLQRLTSLTLFLTFSTIILGVATRVFDAGMSCPDWPTCYGVWNPFHPTAVPAGGYVVNGVSYTIWQVALEWGHRLCASLVGVGLVGMTMVYLRERAASWVPLVLAWGLLAVQIKLGAVTVWFGNVNWSVAAHLGVAMLFFGSLIWFGRDARAAREGGDSPPVRRDYKLMAILLPVAVWCTMVLGGYVSSSHAGGICGGLPDCGGVWIPEDMGQLAHMKHRFFAVLVLVLAFGLRFMGSTEAKVFASAGRAVSGMVLVQVGLGVATLYGFSHYPAYYEILSITHLAFGTLVWMVSVGALLNLRYGTAGRFHG